MRPLWRHYLHNTDAIVFFVDSSDRERMSEARDDLERFLKEDLLRDAPLLVMANKQDLRNVMTVDDITLSLSLSGLSRQWHVQATCATSGAGLLEGLDWLCGAIQRRRNGECPPTTKAPPTAGSPPTPQPRAP